MTWTPTDQWALAMFTIYHNPRDYPGMFAVRRWTEHLGEPQPGDVHLASTLEEARQLIPEGLHNLGREPSDDPAIVETWI